MTKQKIDFTPLHQARISYAEFAKLVGVGRMTAYNWVVRGKSPSPLAAARVASTLSQITIGLEKGFFPLPAPQCDTAEFHNKRLQALFKILRCDHEYTTLPLQDTP